MAQLKNTLVQGSLKATDSIYSNTGQFTIIKALTSASATTYGVGSNGQVLKSDGTKVYWGSDNNSTNYLPLTGGTLSGDLNLQSSSSDSPDIVWKYSNGTEQARIWQGSGGTTKWAPLFREYNSSGSALYNGTLVLGDGTGASGTWNIIANNQYYLTTIGDQRSVATTPSTYSNKLIFHGLKSNSTINSPANNNYSYLLGLRGWSDDSGGNAHELAFNNTGLFWRNGASTTWNAWNQILTSKTAVTVEQGGTGATTAAGARTNLGLGTMATQSSSNYVAKSGDTMTGTLVAPMFQGHLYNGYGYPAGASDKPYHEVLTFTQTTASTQINTRINLLVSNFYGSEDTGILAIRCRWEGNATSPSYCAAEWLIKSSTVNPNNFILTYKYNSTTKVVVLKLYVKVTGWNAYNFTKLSEHNWGIYKNEWVFNSVDKNSSLAIATIPSDETQEISTLLPIQNTAAAANAVAWGNVSGRPTVNSPSTNGTDISFIDTVSQSNGQISATRKTVRDASVSQSGVVSTGTQSFLGKKTLKFTTRVYPLVTSQERSKWYKITFPYYNATTTDSSAKWFMNSFDLHVGNGYSNNPAGVVHVAFYWVRAKSNGAWTAPQVSAKADGVRMDRIFLYYRLAEPGILYVYNAAKVYNGIWLDNLYVDDTAQTLDWTTTKIETIADITSETSPALSAYTQVPTVRTYSAINTATYHIDNPTYINDSIYVTKSGECGLEVDNTQTTNPNKVAFIVGSSGNGGIYSRKHTKWIVYADASGNVVLNGNANTATAFSSNKTIALTGDVTGSASSTGGWSIATTLADSGATAGSYGPASNAEPSYGSTFNVPYITVDAKGRVTAISTKTVKIPASDNSNTLNTAGSTNTTSKIFLVGATSQTTSAQTYSHTYVFETDGALSAKTLGVNYGTTANKVTMQWNDTDKSLDFVFA